MTTELRFFKRIALFSREMSVFGPFTGANEEFKESEELQEFKERRPEAGSESALDTQPAGIEVGNQ